MKRAIRSICGVSVILCLSFCLAACKGTKYVPIGQEQSGSFLSGHKVGVTFNPKFDELYPDCVVIHPTVAPRNLEGLVRFVEPAIERHALQQFDRPITGRKRGQIIRRHNINVLYGDDLRKLGNNANCGVSLRSRIVGQGNRNLISWSRFSVGIEAELVVDETGTIIWKSRDVAERSAGGLPVSPIGLALNSVSAARMSSDTDLPASVVNDAVRRIFQSLRRGG